MKTTMRRTRKTLTIIIIITKTTMRRTMTTTLKLIIII